jgi:Acetyltransferase (GNAT) domain
MSVRSDVIVGRAVPGFLNDIYTKMFSTVVDQRADSGMEPVRGYADIRFTASPEWISAAMGVGANVTVFRTSNKDDQGDALCCLQQTRRSLGVTLLEPVGSPIVDLYHPLIFEPVQEGGAQADSESPRSKTAIVTELLKTVTAHAAKSNRFAVVRLPQVPSESPLYLAAHAKASDQEITISSLFRPRLRVTPGVSVPTLFTQTRTFEEVVSTKQRRHANSKLRAFQRDFPDLKQIHAADEDTQSWLPRLEKLRIARDRATKRGRELETGLSGALWTRYLASVAERLEVFALQAADQLAGFNLVLQDGPTWRVVDGRISSDFASFGLGRVVHQHLTAAALDNDAVQAVEWGRGEQDYKRHITTKAIATVDVVWYSNWFAEFAFLAPGGASHFLKRQVVRFPILETTSRRAIGFVRRLKLRQP